MAAFTFGKQYGWRGYLQLRLFSNRPLLGLAVVGLIWGIWHYPLILVGFEGYENIPLGLAVFPVFTLLEAVIFGWLRRMSDSVWVTSLAHASANSIGGTVTATLFFGGGHFLLTSYSGILGFVPLGLVCVLLVATRQFVPALPRRPAPSVRSAHQTCRAVAHVNVTNPDRKS